jgi:AGCS family alanine or glycine:cation symporter
MSMDAAWATADICMGGMTLINLPACALLGKIAFDCLKDYESQKKSGKNPVFKAESVGFDEGELDFWNYTYFPMKIMMEMPQRIFFKNS